MSQGVTLNPQLAALLATELWQGTVFSRSKVKRRSDMDIGRAIFAELFNQARAGNPAAQQVVGKMTRQLEQLLPQRGETTTESDI
jgi:hypothetical protein